MLVLEIERYAVHHSPLRLERMRAHAVEALPQKLRLCARAGRQLRGVDTGEAAVSHDPFAGDHHVADVT